MTTTRLKMFSDVAALRSLADVANANSLTEEGALEQLLKFEHECGAKLVNIQSDAISLTEAGKVKAEVVQRILAIRAAVPV